MKYKIEDDITLGFEDENLGYVYTYCPFHKSGSCFRECHMELRAENGEQVGYIQHKKRVLWTRCSECNSITNMKNHEEGI